MVAAILPHLGSIRRYSVSFYVVNEKEGVFVESHPTNSLSCMKSTVYKSVLGPIIEKRMSLS